MSSQTNRLTRRDFLKTSAALATGAALAGVTSALSAPFAQPIHKPNILIFIFDAMSARHLSLYGYRRDTTPNLKKFAERASVYHKHYATANFTSTGTASLLTGMYPWTHRAINYRGMVHRDLTERNIFNLIGPGYTRLAFTQNLWADILLSQFEAALDVHLPGSFASQAVYSLVQPDDIPSDRTLAYYIFQDFLNARDRSHSIPGSLLIGSTDLSRALAEGLRRTSAEYPRGLPTNYDFSYEHATVFDGIRQLIERRLVQEPPYLAYFHLWSPHDPYNARKDFVDIFDDSLKVPEKPHHPLSASDHPIDKLLRNRRRYDEFITDLDAEFGKLISQLEQRGILQNSYVIVTSDHGELFERGELGHASALMFSPVTHVPLLISAPGQTAHTDFHSMTCNVDLLPTVLTIAGQEIPPWTEGKLLPGFASGDDANAGRSIFPLVAKDNATFRPITRATFTMIKEGYELFYYTGYPGHDDLFELYHLDEDPDELQNLFGKDITTASHMKEELLEAIHAANRNFQKN